MVLFDFVVGASKAVSSANNGVLVVCVVQEFNRKYAKNKYELKKVVNHHLDL